MSDLRLGTSICKRLNGGAIESESLVGAPLGACRRLSRSSITSCSLQRAELDGLLWTHSRFTSVDFSHASMRDFTDRANLFRDCRFVRTNLNQATFGFEGSQFIDCSFERSLATTTAFVRPLFVRCMFAGNLRDVDFEASSFSECKFVGRIEGGWFRNGYQHASLNNEFGTPATNPMKRVDFREAILWGVAFSGNVELSSLSLPAEHFLVDEWPERVKRVAELGRNYPELRSASDRFLKVFGPGATRQHQYIVYKDFLAHVIGEQALQPVLASLLDQN